MAGKRYRVGSTAGSRKYQKKSTGMVRKSYVSYPVYSTVTTAPAPSRVELKYDDGVITGSISSTPAVTLLSTIANGSGSSERIGRRINYFNMEIRWQWRFASNHGGPNHAKFAIVFDTSPNGTLPAYADIYATTGTESLTNPDTRSRFKILYETNCVSYVNDPAATGGGNWNNFAGTRVIPLKGKQGHFIGTGATIASIEKGAIYIVTNSVQNNVNSLDLYNRIQFFDS